MADDDVVDLAPRPGWRRSVRLLLRGASPDAVAEEATRAICRTLREAKGCPGLGEMLEACARALRMPVSTSWSTEASRIVRRAGGHNHTRLLRDACTAFLQSAPSPSLRPEEHVLPDFVARLLSHYLFAPARLSLHQRLRGLAAVQAVEEAVLARVPLERIGAALLRHPAGSGLRAPRTTRPRPRPTRELLERWPDP